MTRLVIYEYIYNDHIFINNLIDLTNKCKYCGIVIGLYQISGFQCISDEQKIIKDIIE